MTLDLLETFAAANHAVTIQPYGRLTLDQADAVRPHIKGKHVTDFGTGTSIMPQILLALGAKHIEAVDKEDFRIASTPDVTRIRSTFLALPKQPRDVAFVCWPQNNFSSMKTLLTHLRRAAIIVYVGNNVDGNACGQPDLFKYFISRELLAYIPDQSNSLLILGKAIKPARKPTWEERAGMDEEEVYPYNEDPNA